MEKLLLIFLTLLFSSTLLASEHDSHAVDCSSESQSTSCLQLIEPMDHHDQHNYFNEHGDDCHCHHSRTACHQVISSVESYDLQILNMSLINKIQKQSFIHPSPFIKGLFRPPKV